MATIRRKQICIMLAILFVFVAACSPSPTSEIIFVDEPSATPLILTPAQTVTEIPATPSPTVNTSVFQRYVSVFADSPWQDTDIFISCGDQVSIQYISGQWTNWSGHIPFSDASGRYGYICAEAMPANECVEPIPDFWTGALIGQVGDQMLRIGNSLTFTSESEGYLLLRMNDADIGLYDNEGAVTVRVAIQSLSANGIAAPTRTPFPELAVLPERTVVDVYVMIFDPEINGRSLTQTSGFTDPHILMDAYIRDMENITEGSVVYRIARESVIRTFPPKMGGFTYTNEQYWTCVIGSAENAPEYCHWSVDYYAVVNTRFDPDFVSACEAVADYGIDEVWELEGGWLGFQEFRIVPPNSLCNGLDRQFTFMTFNYSRGVAEMLHSQAHRVEYVLQQELGLNLWDQFDGQRQRYAQDYHQTLTPDNNHPEVDANNTHCGNVHFPPNAYLHYQYDRDFPVQSDCDSWLTYPYLTSQSSVLNCDVWGCNQYGFLKWWLYHIPHNPGVSNGIYNNWWKYIFAFGEQ